MKRAISLLWFEWMFPFCHVPNTISDMKTTKFIGITGFVFIFSFIFSAIKKKTNYIIIFTYAAYDKIFCNVNLT